MRQAIQVSILPFNYSNRLDTLNKETIGTATYKKGILIILTHVYNLRNHNLESTYSIAS